MNAQAALIVSPDEKKLQRAADKAEESLGKVCNKTCGLLNCGRDGDLASTCLGSCPWDAIKSCARAQGVKSQKSWDQTLTSWSMIRDGNGIPTPNPQASGVKKKKLAGSGGILGIARNAFGNVKGQVTGDDDEEDDDDDDNDENKGNVNTTSPSAPAPKAAAPVCTPAMRDEGDC